jgi:lysophospholipase L1-like esterase
VNKKIAGLADGQHVHFLDIGQSFLLPDTTISKEIMPDFLHLSPAGYQIWADAMQPKLNELLK